MLLGWLAAVFLALPAGAAQYPSPLPPAAEQVLDQDWCSAASYDKARAVGGTLDDAARRNLSESARTAKLHPRGCRLAERAAHRKVEGIRQHAPWISHGCPVGALPLEHGWRRAAGRGAAAELARIERPVLVGRVTVSAYGTRSLGVIGPCGRAAARRSATVGFQLTRFYPSASASLSIVVAARFRHYGWRVWMVLH